MVFECPACHQKSISLWQKIITAPAIKIRCKNCNAKVYESGLISLLSNLVGYLAAVYLGFMSFIYRDLFYGVMCIITILVFELIKIKFAALKVKT